MGSVTELPTHPRQITKAEWASIIVAPQVAVVMTRADCPTPEHQIRAMRTAVELHRALKDEEHFVVRPLEWKFLGGRAIPLANQVPWFWVAYHDDLGSTIWFSPRADLLPNEGEMPFVKAVHSGALAAGWTVVG
jgi:hypothetical protein